MDEMMALTWVVLLGKKLVEKKDVTTVELLDELKAYCLVYKKEM